MKPAPVRLKHATVAICDACWVKAAPRVIPVRLKVPQEEACNDCGARTSSGIYVRRLIEDK